MTNNNNQITDLDRIWVMWRLGMSKCYPQYLDSKLVCHSDVVLEPDDKWWAWNEQEGPYEVEPTDERRWPAGGPWFRRKDTAQRGET